MSALNIKVSIARRPTSNKARAIRIVASYHQRVTVANAAFYCELSFAQFSTVALQAVVKKAIAQTHAQAHTLVIAGDAAKLYA